VEVKHTSVWACVMPVRLSGAFLLLVNVKCYIPCNVIPLSFSCQEGFLMSRGVRYSSDFFCREINDFHYYGLRPECEDLATIKDFICKYLIARFGREAMWLQENVMQADDPEYLQRIANRLFHIGNLKQMEEIV
jgi:hypothetical protein